MTTSTGGLLQEDESDRQLGAGDREEASTIDGDTHDHGARHQRHAHDGGAGSTVTVSKNKGRQNEVTAKAT